jgi:hypothetical protein
MSNAKLGDIANPMLLTQLFKMVHAMNPVDWLCENAPGFNGLSEEERVAIMHFSLLWSFFEAKALNTNASTNSILTLVHKWADEGRLNIVPFAQSLAYFRNRYFIHGAPTEHFLGLNLRRNDIPDLVSAVLRGENNDPAECVAVLLIVVFRLRNNLFHGVKWAYGIRGQLSNFTNANAVLMAALDIQGHV